MKFKRRDRYVLQTRTILFLTTLLFSAVSFGQYTNWSAPSSWVDGTVPSAGDTVLIPAGKKIILDVAPPPLGGLFVDGHLKFAESDLELKAGFIHVTGELRIGEADNPFQHKAIVTLNGDPYVTAGMGAKYLAVLNGGKIRIHGARREAVSWTQLSSHAAKGKKKINVVDAVDWRPGDEIVIAPSGTNPFQAEKLTVTSVDGNTIHFNPALIHDHFGVIQTLNGVEVDQRAEVGLLTRDILIRGDADSEDNQIGGHMMAMPGASIKVEGAEFYRMGQIGRKARYPVHWHFTGNASGDFAKDNSVHNSFHRAFVIHQTENVLLKDNVAYDINSHAYVIAEDGNEENNFAIGNLGILMKRLDEADFAFFNDDVSGNSTQSENHPGVFWMTNPNNTLIGNHAVGAYNGIGFFYDGIGTANSIPDNFFVNNVAHSNYSYETGWDRAFYRTKGHGLFIGHEELPGAIFEFKNFQSYKNTISGAWIELENHVLNNALLTDNGTGALVFQGTIKNSTIIGQTYNTIRNSTKDYGGINIFSNMPAEKAPIIDNVLIMKQIVGIYYEQDMIGLPSSAKNVSFFQVNRPFYYSEDFLNGAFKDLDGCISGSPSLFFPENYPYLASSCSFDDTYNANVCNPMDYFVLDLTSNNNANIIGDVKITEQNSGNELELYTSELIHDFEDHYEHQKYNYLQKNKKYEIDFYDPGVPNRYFLSLSGHAGGWAYFKINYPEGYGVNIYHSSGNLISPKNSLAHLNPSQSAYYYDQENFELHLVIRLDGDNDYNESVMIQRLSLKNTEMEMANSKKVSLFPNPVMDHVVIQTFLEHDQNVNFDLFDLSGRLLTTYSMDASGGKSLEFIHDLSNYPGGIYFYKIWSEDFSETGKLVKQ